MRRYAHTRPIRVRVGRIGARCRLLTARYPAIQWALIVVLATGTAVTISNETTANRRAREAWGTTVTVWVATRDIAIGEPVAARRRSVPIGLQPATAALDPVGSVARRHVGEGEIVTAADVAAAVDAIPTGWLVAPVIETVRSGATPGDRVTVVSDGFVIAEDGIVTEIHDDVTLVAVPAGDAPALPRHDGVALLRRP